jgi:TonB family protein
MIKWSFFPAIVLVLLLATPLARSQAQTPFLQVYVGQSFLVRERDGLHEVEKIKKGDAEHYNGICDKAVHVKAVKFTKGVLQFDVEDIGMVLPGGNTPRECFRADETRMTKLLISGFNGGESQSELEAVIGLVLQTPETYLTSRGLASVLSQRDAQTTATEVQTPAKLILDVTPWYPQQAIERRIPLELKIQMTVGVDGKLQDVQIVSGAGSGLDAVFLRVLPLWRYEPSRKNGQAVTSPTTFEAKFGF